MGNMGEDCRTCYVSFVDTMKFKYYELKDLLSACYLWILINCDWSFKIARKRRFGRTFRSGSWRWGNLTRSEHCPIRTQIHCDVPIWHSVNLAQCQSKCGSLLHQYPELYIFLRALIESFFKIIAWLLFDIQSYHFYNFRFSLVFKF